MTINAGKTRIVVMCCLALMCAPGLPLTLHAEGPAEKVGVLTTTGTVKVNGTLAWTGEIVVPGSVIETEKGSSAVVNVGKLGSVEALPSSTVKLRYDGVSTNHNKASISILLKGGGVTVSASDGIDFFVESGMTSTRPSSRTGENVFTVNATCGNTLISVAKGKVELHASDGVKRIAEGGHDSAGQVRPGCTSAPYSLVGQR